MFYCENCDTIFEETKSRSEWQGEKEHGGYVYYEVCPYCGSDEYFDACECASCDTYIAPKETFCPECKTVIDDAMNTAFKAIDKVANIGNTGYAIQKWIEEKEKQNVHL